MNNCKDSKKCWIAAVVSIVAVNVMEFLFHGVALREVYMRPHYQNVWNPPAVMGSRRWAMLLGFAVFGWLFAKIYAHGYEESKPATGQGVRYGLLIGFLLTPFHALMQYAVYPVSLKLAFTWIVGGVIECVILGVIVAAIYQPKPATP